MIFNVENKQDVHPFRARRPGRHCRELLYHRFNLSSEAQPVFTIGSYLSGRDTVAFCLSKGCNVEVINEGNPKAFDNYRQKSRGSVGRAVNSSRARPYGAITRGFYAQPVGETRSLNLDPRIGARCLERWGYRKSRV